MVTGIFPPDQRVVIDPGSPLFPLFPFPAVTAVDVFVRRELNEEIKLQDRFGSGITITPNYVLTNAHVIYDFDSFDPEIDETTVRVSTSEKQQLLIDRGIGVNGLDPGPNVIDIYLDDAFLRTGEDDDDIALLRTNNRLLNEDEVIGIIAFVNPQDAVGFAAETAGYPGDNVSQPIPGNSGDEDRDLVVAPASPFLGNVVSTLSERLYIVDSNIDVFQGQSGSGIWTSYQGDPLRIFGLINFAFEGDPPPRRQGGNGGILITTDLYDEIMAQVEADSGTANADLLPENAIIGSDPSIIPINTPFSTNGKDNIFGTYRKERIIGNGGNDRIFGNGGNDRLEGGEGTDIALFSDPFFDSSNNLNYNWEITNAANIDNPEFEFDHTGGSKADGKDTTKEIEFAAFEYDDADRNNIDQQELFYVPLQADPDNRAKLRDGPEITFETDILDEESNKLGEITVTSPDYMFDGDVKYTLNIGSEQGTLYNFAYIIDKSGSMGGENLSAAKSAYNSLTSNTLAFLFAVSILPAVERQYLFKDCALAVLLMPIKIISIRSTVSGFNNLILRKFNRQINDIANNTY